MESARAGCARCGHPEADHNYGHKDPEAGVVLCEVCPCREYVCE